MNKEIKYAHTNIIASDWKKLAHFYIDVCDCEPVYPERDMSGLWIDQLTNTQGSRIQGIHLKLPGYENGPTLEIFSYQPGALRSEDSRINQIGFGHIAFRVDDVDAAIKKVIEHNGKMYGEVVEKEIENVGRLTVAYARDIEGNIIEFQHWQEEE